MPDKKLLETLKFVETKTVLMSQIRFDTNNPNIMSKEKHEAFDHVITKYGFAKDPWLNDQGDGTYLVIDGEQGIRRMQAHNVKKFKAKIFKVKYSDVRILRQIANKLHGEHDKKKDAAEFKEIFDSKDLEEFAKLLAEPLEDFERILEKQFKMKFERPESEEVPARPKNPKSKLGDVYLLGKHKIVCGDCTNSDQTKKLFGDLKPNQIVTDPPYGIDYSSKNEFLNKADKGNQNQTPIINDNIKDYREFFRNFLKIISMEIPNTIYIFMGNNHLHNLRIAFEEAGFTWSQYLLWIKNNHVLGRNDYYAKHEHILYGWKGKHKFYGPHDTTVLSYNKPHSSDLHPTMKPLELVARLIKDGSQENFIVYDPFLGSGSTLIACEQTGRICYGMEIDPAYVDVIIQRWENFTKQKAKKLN